VKEKEKRHAIITKRNRNQTHQMEGDRKFLKCKYEKLVVIKFYHLHLVSSSVFASSTDIQRHFSQSSQSTHATCGGKGCSKLVLGSLGANCSPKGVTTELETS